MEKNLNSKICEDLKLNCKNLSNNIHKMMIVVKCVIKKKKNISCLNHLLSITSSVWMEE